jgi:hypothetical protein
MHCRGRKQHHVKSRLVIQTLIDRIYDVTYQGMCTISVARAVTVYQRHNGGESIRSPCSIMIIYI